MLQWARTNGCPWDRRTCAYMQLSEATCMCSNGRAPTAACPSETQAAIQHMRSGWRDLSVMMPHMTSRLAKAATFELSQSSSEASLMTVLAVTYPTLRSSSPGRFPSHTSAKCTTTSNGIAAVLFIDYKKRNSNAGRMTMCR